MGNSLRIRELPAKNGFCSRMKRFQPLLKQNLPIFILHKWLESIRGRYEPTVSVWIAKQQDDPNPSQLLEKNFFFKRQ